MHTFPFSESWFSSCLILKPRKKNSKAFFSETALFIRSQKDERFKDVLNKQNPAMLSDWNAGSPQHNSLGPSDICSKLCTKALQTPCRCPPSVDTELSNWGYAASRLKLLECLQWVQSQVCTEPCHLPGLMCAHHVWAWPEIIDPKTERVSSREEIKAECLIFDIQHKLSQKYGRYESSLLITTINVCFIDFGLLVYTFIVLTWMLCAHGPHKCGISGLIVLAEEVKCDCWGRF